MVSCLLFLWILGSYLRHSYVPFSISCASRAQQNIKCWLHILSWMSLKVHMLSSANSTELWRICHSAYCFSKTLEKKHHLCLEDWIKVVPITDDIILVMIMSRRYTSLIVIESVEQGPAVAPKSGATITKSTKSSRKKQILELMGSKVWE